MTNVKCSKKWHIISSNSSQITETLCCTNGSLETVQDSGSMDLMDPELSVSVLQSEGQSRSDGCCTWFEDCRLSSHSSVLPGFVAGQPNHRCGMLLTKWLLPTWWPLPILLVSCPGGLPWQRSQFTEGSWVISVFLSSPDWLPSNEADFYNRHYFISRKESTVFVGLTEIPLSYLASTCVFTFYAG